MEYYQTELARAQSLSSKNPELMTTDYTTCCNVTEKKDDSKTATTPKVRRKRKGEDEDPDYHPITIDEPPHKKPVPPLGPGYTIITANGPRPILPKVHSIRPTVPNAARPQVPQGQVYRVGNTTFRTKAPGGVLIQRVNPNQDVRNASPGYITIPPSSAVKTTAGIYFQNFTQLRTTSAPIRPQGAYTVVSGTNNGNPIFSTVRAPKVNNQLPVMKHEWFEKTVRAAARVNSNLSYTLTQLNRQQSQAANVEALATVHNKLQEVLSTSINSLIQIRKNLRTEFIAGIKTIKFPPKPVTGVTSKPPNAPIVLNDDDDVIFINPTSTASQSQALSAKVQGTLILSKKLIQKSNPFVNPKPSTSGLNAIKISGVTTTATPPAPVKGGFLKVRSFTSLQSVPSECITIPDDPPPYKITEVDPLSFTTEEDPLALPSEIVAKPNHAKPVSSKLSKQKPKTTEAALSPMKIDRCMVINVKRKQTPHVQKMMSAFVRLERSADVDKMMAKATKNGHNFGAGNKSGGS
ncbi:uncharacterized protein LOC125502572 [Dendroctonus ponderosae]|uniref:uncharacterized protein LOC125502572 n=1 Tax=Dendroctonus ponderosae TaxID=77166 RepID=UPI0020365B79|nr:uncharacterized protein LOC125502572 [Dendroctonus ponderosae]